MSVHNTRSRAFTLVEMLTVMAVISTLMAILLPAVNHVREIGRRTMCASNMRQLALAANVYHSIHQAFPCGQVGCPPVPNNAVGVHPDLMYKENDACVGPNWLALLLVHLDEKGLADALISCTGGNNGSNVYSACSNVFNKLVPAYFICPSAPTDMTTTKEGDASKLFKIGSTATNKGNYAGCWGMEVYYNAWGYGANAYGSSDEHFGQPLYHAQMDGVFGYVYVQRAPDANKRPTVVRGLFKLGHGKGTRIDYIKDGIAKTIMISEVLGHDFASDCRGAWFWGGMGASAFTAKGPPNAAYGSGPKNGGASSQYDVDLRDNITYCGPTPTNRYDRWLTCRQGDGFRDYASARSGHPGGVNVAMADTSTRFFPESIDEYVWKAASTKNGKFDTEASSPMPPAY